MLKEWGRGAGTRKWYINDSWWPTAVEVNVEIEDEKDMDEEGEDIEEETK